MTRCCIKSNLVIVAGPLTRLHRQPCAGGISLAIFTRMAKTKRNDEEQPRVQAANTAPELDRDRVAERAYELYLSRGGTDGLDQNDWFIAEQELISNKKSDK